MSQRLANKGEISAVYALVFGVFHDIGRQHHLLVAAVYTELQEHDTIDDLLA